MKADELSIKQLSQFLEKIITAPDKYIDDSALLSALRSQGTLAKFSISELNITGSSINTMKRRADCHIYGGFAHVDQLRRNAYEALQNQAARLKMHNRTSKNGLAARISDLQTENQILKEELLLVTFVLEKSIGLVREHSEQLEGVALAKSQREQRELLDMLSLTQKQRH